MPRSEHEGVDVPIPSPPLPVPINPQSPKPPILVQRRTLSRLLILILVLFMAVGALLYKTLSGGGTKEIAAVSPSSSSTSTSTPGSPSPTAPTDSASAGAPSPTPAALGSPSAAASPQASGSDIPSETAAPVGSFSPVFGTQFLGSPVDGSVDTQVDVHISNGDYPNSIQFYCPNSGMLDWNVAGYATFSATFGIPDDARSATGITNTVTFADQNGRTLKVAKTSIGQPARIQFGLAGVERLVVSCARQGSNDSVNNLIALGSATVSTS